MTSVHYTTLRKHRRRYAFTQAEIAYLMGGMCGTKVSRYERAARRPHLHTALACQIIYGVSVDELFPGVYDQTIFDIKRRARTLLKEFEAKGYPQHKKDRLTAILEAL